jgi:hypothetical protein
MFRAFSAILSWLTGGGIAAIGKELRLAHEAKLKAANDSERIAADVRIRELEAQQASILQAQRDNVERWVRVGFAAPFVAYNAKLIVYDKMLGWGVTDPLSPELTYIQMTVLGGYFFLWTAKAIRK